jgi:hypothetical protein
MKSTLFSVLVFAQNNKSKRQEASSQATIHDTPYTIHHTTKQQNGKNHHHKTKDFFNRLSPFTTLAWLLVRQ